SQDLNSATSAGKSQQHQMLQGLPLSKKLHVRYNHSERKNHTKFFAKLFSHWLKTPLFQLHPLFYRERSQPHHDTMSSSREKGKKKSTFNPAIPPFEGILSSPPPAAEAGPFLPS